MDNNYTWIFIIVGIFILFFLLSHTIYITTSNVQTPITPENSCGVSTYGCCPDKLTTKTDSWGSNCQKQPQPQPQPNTMMPGSSTSPILPIQPTTAPSTSVTPTPYVGQNVANTTSYPPNTMLIPIPIPSATTNQSSQADQQTLPPQIQPQ